VFHSAREKPTREHEQHSKDDEDQQGFTPYCFLEGQRG